MALHCVHSTCLSTDLLIVKGVEVIVKKSQKKKADHNRNIDLIKDHKTK